MFKSMISKAALASLLLAPVLASAAVSTKTFSDSDNVNVKLDGSGFAIVAASWQDLVLQASKNTTQEFQASSLVWNLYKGNSLKLSGSFSDTVGDTNAGQIVINESGLAKGEYKLVFSGTWTVPATKWEDSIEQKVKLGKATYSSVSPVPEPETYAMLLVGLGVMGAIAMRRRKSDES